MTTISPEPWLKTERLRLREFSLADRDALVAMHKDPRVRALLVDDHPLERHTVTHNLILRLQEWYRQHEGLGIWCAEQMVATLKDSDLERPEVREVLSPSALAKLARPQPRFAGWFSLMLMTDQPEEVELGSRLLPAVWGVGLALEGGEALLEHAFNTLERERVWAAAHPDHRPVRYCVTALGFEEHGTGEYEGSTACYYLINKTRWRQWRKLPRRQRQRRAVIACREIADQDGNS